MSNRFDQCTETCTTDCGHCKGRPVEQMRAEIVRLRTEVADLQQRAKRATDIIEGILAGG